MSNKTDFYNAVFDILVRHAGVPGHDFYLRDDFIYHHARAAQPVDEYRFGGSLGFGGKYRRITNQVDCYPEDETPERLAAIAATNAALANLKMII